MCNKPSGPTSGTTILIAIIITCYVIAGIVTFGHAHNTIKRVTYLGADDVVERTFMSLLSSAAWPLYWSSEIFKHHLSAASK